MLPEPVVGLLQRLEPEARKAKPRRPHVLLPADFEAESPDRKEVRGGAEVEVGVHAPFDLRSFRAVHRPDTIRRRERPDGDGFAADASGHFDRARAPVGTAEDPVFEAAGVPLVRKDGGAAQTPARFRRDEKRGFVTGPVESPPHDAGCVVDYRLRLNGWASVLNTTRSKSSVAG